MASSSNSENMSRKMLQAIEVDDARGVVPRNDAKPDEAKPDEAKNNEAVGVVHRDDAKPDEAKKNEQPRIEWYCFTIGEVNQALARKSKLDLGCVTWLGRSMSLKFQGRNWDPRRLAWMLHCRLNELPKWTRIIQTCGNAKCIRPEHMLARRVGKQ